jgi:hypothetical protein
VPEPSNILSVLQKHGITCPRTRLANTLRDYMSSWRQCLNTPAPDAVMHMHMHMRMHMHSVTQRFWLPLMPARQRVLRTPPPNHPHAQPGRTSTGHQACQMHARTHTDTHKQASRMQLTRRHGRHHKRTAATKHLPSVIPGRSHGTTGTDEQGTQTLVRWQPGSAHGTAASRSVIETPSWVLPWRW